MSRVRRYSRSGPTAQPPRSPTGLSPPAVTRSSGLRLTDAGAARRLPPPPAHSFNPLLASPAGYSASRVWAPPRSLAATKGILSVPRGTEMFQFPRCPRGDCAPRARPCAGRVAPFGHPRIAGCQRLPGAFRRVAASFLGRQRQGIHHAPIMRISCAVPPEIRRDRDRRPARASGMVPSAAPPAPSTRRLVAFGVVLVSVSCVCVCCCAVRAGEQTRAPASHRSRCDVRLGSCPAPCRADIVPRPQNPTGPAWRLVKVQDREVFRLVGRRGRQTSSEAVLRPRTRSPNPLARASRAAGLLAGRRVVAAGGAPAPGGAAGTRTPDLRRARAALSQLSYGPAPLRPR
jgi:hypothetical protein